MEGKSHHPEPPKSRKLHALITLIITALSLTILVVVNHDYFHSTYGLRDAKRFEKTLHSKGQIILDEFQKLPEAFNGSTPLQVLDEQSARFRKLSVEEGIYFFYYEGN